MYHFVEPKEVKKINITEICDAVAVSGFLKEIIKDINKEEAKDKFVVLEQLYSWNHSNCPNHIYKGYQDELCTIYQAQDLFCLERLAVVEAFKEWAKDSGFEERNSRRWQIINSEAIKRQYEAENRVAHNEDFTNIQDVESRNFYREVFKRAENAS